MKSILKYIIALSVLSGMIVSCSFKEESILPGSGSDNGTRVITAFVENFSRHDVATKATDAQERKINNLAMLVYAQQNGQMDLITDPLYVGEGMLNFVINTTRKADGTGQFIANLQGGEQNSFADFAGDLTKARIYIVANMNEELQGSEVGTEEDLLDVGYQIMNMNSVPQGGAPRSYIDVPEGGFPMIGWTDVDLSPESSLGSGSETALNVPLKKLFAKIYVKFVVQLNTENVPGDMGIVKTPYFEPIEWSVCNIPSKITIRDDDPAAKPADAVFETQKFTNTTFNFSTEQSKASKKIENSNNGEEYFDFTFYVPEYKVLPATDRTSKTGVEEQFLQYYKPTFCSGDQTPTYVYLKGKYSDHQGHISEVQYKLYLGQDHVDDFQILRNQELKNTAIIRGLRSHSDGLGDVSIDHRVDVTSSGYSIAMERETLLDSHFEFRPMDISIQEGAVVVVKVPKNDWFGAERADRPLNSNQDAYDSSKPGLRKYFTTDLLDELGTTTSDKVFVFEAEDDGDGEVDEVTYRLWFYFDENAGAPYDDSYKGEGPNELYRQDKILVDYYNSTDAYDDGNGTPTTADREFMFRQMNLWTINGHITNTQYGIEYFEEYLYNYAADDNFGVTTDGMAWGLYNEPLSNQYQALYASPNDMGGLLSDNWSLSKLYTQLFDNIDARYDFYLTRDFPEDFDIELVKPRDYSGLSFTQEIARKSGIVDKPVTLSGNASSAVEYCYNKNKRNDEGEVETLHWYLPAIDETEEILVDGFFYFPVFQSKWYWSSQPAFDRYNYKAGSFIGSWFSSSSGYYFKDDLDRARATKVADTQTNTEAPSGVTGAVAEREITLSVLFQAITSSGTETPTGDNIVYDAGNFERSKINRVRCAYSAEGISLVPYPLSDIIGTWSVSASQSTSSSSTTQFTVSISKSDDLTKGNVKLSNFIHRSYHSTDYPQYATYNTETGQLSITMGQQIGVANNGGSITSRLYSGNNSQTNQPLVLQYQNDSFTPTNSNYNVRPSNSTSNTNASYIRSFTKQ